MAKIKNAQQYAERYKKRGERAKRKLARDIIQGYTSTGGLQVASEQFWWMTPRSRKYYTLDMTKGSKPEHAKRVSNIGSEQMKFANPASMSVAKRVTSGLEDHVSPKEMRNWRRKMED